MGRGDPSQADQGPIGQGSQWGTGHRDESKAQGPRGNLSGADGRGGERSQVGEG